MPANGGQMMGFRRGVWVLKVLARYPEGCTFGQLQKQLDDLPAPTLSRLLKVMVDERMVAKDPAAGIYKTGPLAFNLSRRFLGRATVPEVMQPIVDQLAEVTGESAAYAEYENSSIIFLATKHMPQSFHYMEIGSPNTKVAYHGFGQICLAHLPEGKTDLAVRKSPVPLPLPEKQYRARLNKIKKDGYFIEYRESQDVVTRVIAPVFKGKGGTFLGALGITALANKLTTDRKRNYIAAVTEAAAQATELIKK